jgi:hypothetical protein
MQNSRKSPSPNLPGENPVTPLEITGEQIEEMMARKRRPIKKAPERLNPDEQHFVEEFEAEYSRLLEEEELEAAKAYFRENFMVSCFGCGYLGKTVPPLNCARCGLYLD